MKKRQANKIMTKIRRGEFCRWRWNTVDTAHLIDTGRPLMSRRIVKAAAVAYELARSTNLELSA